MSGSWESREELQRASQIIAQSRYAIGLVGAGMSAESGIPTYRGPGGLWTRIGEPDPRSYQNFVADPRGWWERMLDKDNHPESTERAQFREAIERAQPNSGHYALVDLERMGILKHIITQNVDNLHRAVGSLNVTEIHGNRTLVRCMECNLRMPWGELDVIEVPPKCPQCHGIIKGDGVMFGEPIPSDVFENCYRETNLCDCMLILGTSGTVYPAAGFPIQARQRGAAIIEVNVHATPLSGIADVSLQGPAGEILPVLVARVGELLAPKTQRA